jgi:NADH-quinone oxidoreductase subunit D
MTGPAILFCVGATKAGTSWLWEWLRGHPQAHLRSIKELHWFDAVETDRLQREAHATRLQIAEAEALGARPDRIADLRDWLSVLEQGNDAAYMGYLRHGADRASLVADVTPAYALLPEERLRHMAGIAPVRVSRDDAQTGEQKIRNFNINFGPQHPAAHGVLRLVLELDGEIVERCDPHIGLLHRGTEKLMESRTYLQNLPYFDRLDYVAPMNQEHAWCLAIERLTGVQCRAAPADPGAVFEIGRILNHLLNVTTQAMDVGALTPPLWGFEEREKLMVFYERACGARLHAAYFRPGGVHQDLPPACWTISRPGRMNSPGAGRYRRAADRKPHLQAAQRRYRRGDEQDILDWGYSGVMVRGSGLAWDLRRAQPYECYDEFDFKIPVGKNGDCYDRYLCRMAEMRESTSIILQAIAKLREPAKGRAICWRAARSRRRRAPR